MVDYVVAKNFHDLSVEWFHLAVGLQVLCCAKQVFRPQERADVLEELCIELIFIVGAKSHWWDVCQTPVGYGGLSHAFCSDRFPWDGASQLGVAARDDQQESIFPGRFPELTDFIDRYKLQ